MTECGFNASAFLFFHRDYGCDIINYIIELKLKRAHLHILGTICEKFNWNWYGRFGVLSHKDGHTSTRTDNPVFSDRNKAFTPSKYIDVRRTLSLRCILSLRCLLFFFLTLSQTYRLILSYLTLSLSSPSNYLSNAEYLMLCVSYFTSHSPIYLPKTRAKPRIYAKFLLKCFTPEHDWPSRKVSYISIHHFLVIAQTIFSHRYVYNLDLWPCDLGLVSTSTSHQYQSYV